MKIRADVACFHCGHVSAELVGEQGVPIHPSMISPSSVANLVMPKAGRPLRCIRCGGPCYLDNKTIVREELASLAEEGKRKRRRRSFVVSVA